MKTTDDNPIMGKNDCIVGKNIPLIPELEETFTPSEFTARGLFQSKEDYHLQKIELLKKDRDENCKKNYPYCLHWNKPYHIRGCAGCFEFYKTKD